MLAGPELIIVDATFAVSTRLLAAVPLLMRITPSAPNCVSLTLMWVLASVVTVADPLPWDDAWIPTGIGPLTSIMPLE